MGNVTGVATCADFDGLVTVTFSEPEESDIVVTMTANDARTCLQSLRDATFHALTDAASLAENA